MLDASSPVAGGFIPTGWREEPEFRWYVVNTEFQRELLVLNQIRKLGICAWLPEMLHRSGRIVPLFQRYMLAQFDVAGAQPWRYIYGMMGARTILGTRNEKPTPLPVGAAETLMAGASINGVYYPESGPRKPSRRARRCGSWRARSPGSRESPACRAATGCGYCSRCSAARFRRACHGATSW
jgi:Transcription termination factor nusG